MSTNSRITVPIGALASSLDIFVEDTSTGLAIDPSGITFRIYNPLGSEVVTETSGARLSLGHYSASGVTIPAGSSVGEGWRIDWSVVLTGGTSGTFSEAFCTSLPTLSATFQNPDGEVQTIYDRVRVDLGDINGQIFTDGIMQRTLNKAIPRLNRRLGLVDLITGNRPFHFFLFFNSSLQRPKLEVDLQAGTITPDTDPYVDILVLQMEEILLKAEFATMRRLNQNVGGALASGISSSATEGVSVTNADGVKISVAPARFSARAKMAEVEVDRITEELNNAIRDFRWRLAGAAGLDVTCPRYGYTRLGAFYNGYNGSAQ